MREAFPFGVGEGHLHTVHPPVFPIPPIFYLQMLAGALLTPPLSIKNFSNEAAGLAHTAHTQARQPLSSCLNQAVHMCPFPSLQDIPPV